MSNIPKQLQEIEIRLNTLRHYQQSMQEEIVKLEERFRQVKAQVGSEPSTPPIAENVDTNIPVITAPVYKQSNQETEKRKTGSLLPENMSLENFIGTNLISKIGILITIIGVFIGARSE